MASYYDIFDEPRENLEVQAVRQHGEPEPLVVFRNSYRGTAEFSLTLQQTRALVADLSAWLARREQKEAA
jgi:hypothetical protein